MATPDVTAGRPTGDSQHHDHEKRSHDYSFQTGGTVVSIPHSGNNANYNTGDDAGPNGAMEGYDFATGGNAVKQD